jgi:ferredoxin-type protein NapF
MALISRAQFLRGDWRTNKPRLYPPWALAEALFLNACDGCGECIKACPQDILKLSAGDCPQVDFSRGECTFCGDCVTACPTKALRKADDNLPWQLKARISPSCLAINGTSCVRCLETCPEEAIVARPSLGGRTQISVEESSCSGCGACISSCPVAVISIQCSDQESRSDQELKRSVQ